MKNKWILGVLALVVILGGLFLMGYIETPGVDHTKSDVELTFYDEDGNELGKIDTKLAILGVRTAGFEGDVHSVGVRVNFEVTTTMECVAIYSSCFLGVETVLDDGQGTTVVHAVAEGQMDSQKSGLTGSFEGTYLMSNLLPTSAVTDAGKQMGWIMTFTARVVTDVDYIDYEDDIQKQKQVEDSCSISLTLTWYEHELSVDSYFVNPVIG